jgi:hypothetical protein
VPFDRLGSPADRDRHAGLSCDQRRARTNATGCAADSNAGGARRASAIAGYLRLTWKLRLPARGGARRAPREGAARSSQQSPGVYWALNDSGNPPRLYAFDAQGQAIATIRPEGATNEDWEALAVGPGSDGGQALYVADTGDNRGVRRESIIYRIAEPPIAPGQNNAPSIRAPAERIRFSFPGRSLDVEALLVHPQTGEMVLVSKEYAGRATVFRLRQAAGSGRAELTEVGALNLSALGALVSAVTDASVAPDGRRVALRTYNAVVEFELADSAELASIWQLQPRIYPLSDSPQGEGITYRADGRALLTIGEQSPAVLFQLDWRC